jgi:hypothetical protein
MWIENKKSIAFPLLGIFFILFLFIFELRRCPPHFGTPDDEASVFSTMGISVADSPQAEILFSHIAFGKTLVFMLPFFPEISPYSFILIFCHFILCLTLFTAWLLTSKKASTFLLLSTFWIIALFPQLHSPTFTSSSAWLGVSGLIWFFVYLERKNALFLFFSILLLAGSEIMRLRVGYLYAALTVPLGLFYFIKVPALRKRVAVFYVSTIAVFMVLKISNDRHYEAHPEWASVRSLLGPLTSIFDYKTNYSPKEEWLSKAGWTREEYGMLHANFQIKEVFPIERMIKLDQEFPSRYTDGAHFSNSINHICKDRAFLYLVFFLVSLFVLFSWNIECLTLILGLVLLVSLIILVMILFLKIKPTVYIPLLYSVFFVGLLIVKKERLRLRIALSAFYFSVVVLYSLKQWMVYPAFNESFSEDTLAAKKDFQMISTLKENILIAWSPIGLHRISIFEDFKNLLSGIKIIELGGFRVDFPYSEFYKPPVGANFYQALASDPKLLLLSHPFRNNYYANYMKKHHGTEIEFIPCIELSEGKIYRVRKKGNNLLSCPQKVVLSE